MSSRYRIQRKDILNSWEDIAFPTIKDRFNVFQYCKEQEEKKRYKRPLRLIKETIEVEQFYEL